MARGRRKVGGTWCRSVIVGFVIPTGKRRKRGGARKKKRLEGTWRGSKGDYLRDGFVFWDTRYGAL